MIPIRLYISGFLSYREPVEIDFTSFDLACIAGPNGAGKSSLLDAITWALFGQARKRDDSLIHSRSSVAEVRLVFSYESNLYTVRRIKPRDKTMLLEFQIWQGNIPQPTADSQQPAAHNKGMVKSEVDGEGQWRPLTERTLRETELRILQTLRMDYETFINASFFLQGKADQFTQQRPGDRKRILGSILGLEIWESYRQRAAERRKLVESDITGLDGRLKEISTELTEEQARRNRLQELESDLKRLEEQRHIQEAAAQTARQIAATLQEQARMVEVLRRQLEALQLRAEESTARLKERLAEKESYTAALQRAGQTEAAYNAWQATKAQLEQVEKTAAQFRETEKQRESPRLEIQAARARLEQELQSLSAEQAQVEAGAVEVIRLRAEIEAAGLELEQAEAQLQQRFELDASLQAARQRQADARAENPRLKAEMEELKERINQLCATEGAECPLCGQLLSNNDRLALIERLNLQGREMGDRYRANQNAVQQSDDGVRLLQAQIAGLSTVEGQIRQHTSRLAQLNSQVEMHEQRRLTWETQQAARLAEVRTGLENETYAPEARRQLAEIDAQLKRTGYDAAAHDTLRQAEQTGRASESELRALEKARAALVPLEREIAGLSAQEVELLKEAARQGQEYEQAVAVLAVGQSQAPDLDEAERRLLGLKEQENRLRMEMGAAKQKVDVLANLKARQNEYEAQREDLARQVGQYRQLERAFGKDGVPALLIEQALPEIETRANDILTRLSAGSMSVRFVTQGKYKDKSREDLKETLEIQISDGAGMRDYEMFSGGEAFRVNFAIRLALSEVLAQRAGARLQTLVIDEGFGSQDNQGRQRLIEAINLVRNDFAIILVITHIDELKDAFPNRIEVEKTDQGSTVKII
jgi:DNA repair protein SbcC/Rad50